LNLDWEAEGKTRHDYFSEPFKESLMEVYREPREEVRHGWESPAWLTVLSQRKQGRKTGRHDCNRSVRKKQSFNLLAEEKSDFYHDKVNDSGTRGTKSWG